MKTIFLAIDLQNDFCDRNGSLFVKNADKVCDTISKLPLYKFSQVTCSLDWHPLPHLSFPSFWQEKVDVFKTYKTTPLTPTMLRQGYSYYRTIDSEVTIYPEHCIRFTWGSCLEEKIMNRLRVLEPKNVVFGTKGILPTHEEFSAFHCLSNALHNSDKIYIGGVAGDICVYHTVVDLCKFGMGKKIVLLSDCIASVNSSEDLFKVVLKNGGSIIESGDLDELK